MKAQEEADRKAQEEADKKAAEEGAEGEGNEDIDQEQVSKEVAQEPKQKRAPIDK